MTAAIDRASDLLISLPDVARLAEVQRPVVSMWRKRSAPSSRPFPPSVPVEGAHEMFQRAHGPDHRRRGGRAASSRLMAGWLAALSAHHLSAVTISQLVSP